MDNSGENPFTEAGVLSRKADFIISNSKITRNSIKIVDPDDVDSSLFANVSSPDSCRLVSPNASTSFNIEPVPAESLRNDCSVDTNDVEVTKVEIHFEKCQLTEPMRAEEVKADRKKSCCTVC
ncbi:hypothetical protein HELRODRAFT_160474 [Helobdella robusta]|uniref:Uncharacterized protein n=1 Tax=Helobdella robusta TaxID=6412 RepID=T1EQA6_HELRO|nr:hypothetical protein HELRODRAFT_160474 [Helobdella robusta]ESO06311.1 hypothetical protein HELRODRAFT_160474 [Helobdella robusta]